MNKDDDWLEFFKFISALISLIVAIFLINIGLREMSHSSLNIKGVVYQGFVTEDNLKLFLYGSYKTKFSKTETLKSKNKFKVNDNIEDLIDPDYDWEEIVPQKNQMETTINIVSEKPQTILSTIRSIKSQYTIKP